MLDAFVKAIREKTGLVPVVQKVHGVDRLLMPNADGSFGLEDLVEPHALATPLHVTTLSAIIDYVKNPDHAPTEDRALIIHVRSAEEVAVSSRILKGDFAQRETYLVANAENLVEGEVDEDDDDEFTFQLGKFVDHETFIIALQSMFCESDGRKTLLTLAGSARGEVSGASSDDGYSQTVAMSRGAHLVSPQGETVPNPHILAPYRTFRDLAQPASPFVLRLKQVPGSPRPEFALFQADGGGWRVQAIAAIKAYLATQLTGEDGNLLAGVTILA